jgi:hypothetical protein
LTTSPGRAGGQPVRWRVGHRHDEEADEDQGGVLGAVSTGADDEPAHFAVDEYDARGDLGREPQRERTRAEAEGQADAARDFDQGEDPRDCRTERKA